MEPQTDNIPFKSLAFFYTDVWHSLRARVISALVMSTVFLFATIAGGLWFTAVILLSSLFMLREWDVLTAGKGGQWKWWGIAYVALPCMALLWIRAQASVDYPNAGMLLTLYLVLIIWATDIGAYFAGRAIGGPKLAPVISPNKTWAGLLGGALAAGAVGALASTFTPYPTTFLGCITTAMVLAVISQGGDLFESWLKRGAGMKDSSELIPGHGGILDRIDGLVVAAPVFAVMVMW